MNFKKKSKKQNITASTLNLLTIVDYSDLNDCFITKNGMMDILQIECKNLTALSEADIEFEILAYDRMYKLFSEDFKIVSMRFPTDTSQQIKYITNKIQKTKNPVMLETLKEKENEMNRVAQERSEREYFVFVFGDDGEALNNNRSITLNNITMQQNVRKIPKDKKLKILFKINNMSSLIA